MVAASNDEDLDKKSLGIEVKNGEIIECIRNGNIFSIRKAGEDNKSITFKLPPNKNYRFAAYLFSGWDSKEAKVSEARMETLWYLYIMLIFTYNFNIQIIIQYILLLWLKLS